ncbi:MAG: sodium:solute symporter family protein [Acidaminococcales bacterium]|nr:sodium:solute symporter family protein [Acidaminococcales bacterium]
MDNTIALSIMVIFCIALLIASFYAKKYQEKKSRERGGAAYLLAARSFGILLVSVTTIGFAIGANTTTGISQRAYSMGFSGGWYGYAFVIGLIFTGVVFAKKYRASGIVTISRIYGDYYGEGTRFVASIGQLFMNFTLMVAQFVGGGSIISTLLPEYFTFGGGIIISMIIFTLICLAGGMMSAGITNLLNIAIIYISIIASAIMGLNAVGGWSVLTEKLPAHYFSPVGTFGMGGIIAYLLLFIVNVPTSQAAIQMILSAKDDITARNGYLIGGLLLLLPSLCSVIVGMVAAVMFPGLQETATALPKVATSFSGIVTGLVLAGMWAAIISTASTMIVSNSTLLLNDILKPVLKWNMSDQQEVLVSRIAMILCSLLVGYFALYQRSILTVVTVGLALSVGYFFVLLISWYFPQFAKASTGMALIGCSCVTSAAWFIVPWFATILPHVLYLQLITCGVVFLLTFLDRRPAFFLTSKYEEKFGRKFVIPK